MKSARSAIFFPSSLQSFGALDAAYERVGFIIKITRNSFVSQWNF